MALPTCYTRYNGIIEPARSGIVPYGRAIAGQHRPCCFFTDRCLQGSQTNIPICQFPGIHNNTSGYYAAGCTDPDWIDASCPKHCDGPENYLSDITYIPGSSLWACCETYANRTTNCLMHTEDTWTDVMPQDLHQYVSPPPSTTPSKSHRLALGLGIGLGLGVSLLIVIALAAIIWKHKRRKSRHSKSLASTPEPAPEIAVEKTTELPAPPPAQALEEPGGAQELPGGGPRYEIDQSRTRYELAGSKMVNGLHYQ